MIANRRRPQPIGMRQLCFVARQIIESDRGIDDAEWKERIKCRIIALGKTYPERGAQAISDTLDRVEAALTREWGPRPIVAPRRVPPAERPAHVPRPIESSPWNIPRQGGGSGFSLAIGEQQRGNLTTALAQCHPEALAAIRKAARSPEVKAAIARARQRTARERDQRPPSRDARLLLQRALLFALADPVAVAMVKAARDDNAINRPTNSDIPRTREP